MLLSQLNLNRFIVSNDKKIYLKLEEYEALIVIIYENFRYFRVYTMCTSLKL